MEHGALFSRFFGYTADALWILSKNFGIFNARQRTGEVWLGQQYSATAGAFLRKVFEESGKQQFYRVAPKGQSPWLVGVFDRSADGSPSNFSGLELVVMREVPNVSGHGKDKFIQLARFENLDKVKAAFSIGYANGDLVSDQKGEWRPAWFEMTRLRSSAMYDLFKPSSGQKREVVCPLTKAESYERVVKMMMQLENLSEDFQALESAPELEGFR